MLISFISFTEEIQMQANFHTDDEGSFDVSIYELTRDIPIKQNNFLLLCKHVVASCA
jgi:hypothetical protein